MGSVIIMRKAGAETTAFMAGVAGIMPIQTEMASVITMSPAGVTAEDMDAVGADVETVPGADTADKQSFDFNLILF